MSGYVAKQDEILAGLANTGFLEQVEDKDNTDNGKETVNLDKAIAEHRTEVPTPLKWEKSLKRHSTNTIDMEIYVSTKRARTSTQQIEVVSLDEDDEGSINQAKGTIIEEEKDD